MTYSAISYTKYSLYNIFVSKIDNITEYYNPKKNSKNPKNKF